jgi:hypothetical protein
VLSVVGDPIQLNSTRYRPRSEEGKKGDDLQLDSKFPGSNKPEDRSWRAIGSTHGAPLSGEVLLVGLISAYSK